jgi:hypothetical protein
MDVHVTKVITLNFFFAIYLCVHSQIHKFTYHYIYEIKNKRNKLLEVSSKDTFMCNMVNLLLLGRKKLEPNSGSFLVVFDLPCL